MKIFKSVQKLSSNLKKHSTGLHAENKAKQYLIGQGLKFVTSNYASRYGEIDLIMRHRDTLIFVEVRFRNTDKYGGALASVTKAKQTKIVATAQQYMLDHQIGSNHAIRFDVVGINNEIIDWIQGAF